MRLLGNDRPSPLLGHKLPEEDPAATLPGGIGEHIGHATRFRGVGNPRTCALVLVSVRPPDVDARTASDERILELHPPVLDRLGALLDLRRIGHLSSEADILDLGPSLVGEEGELQEAPTPFISGKTVESVRLAIALEELNDGDRGQVQEPFHCHLHANPGFVKIGLHIVCGHSGPSFCVGADTNEAHIITNYRFFF